MKKFSLLFTLVLLFGTFAVVKAQNGEPPPGAQGFAPAQGPNLLEALGLTREQVQQLRRLNAVLQPQRKELQRNLKEANDALDEAIYADETNDEIIRERVRAVQQAQSELIRHRAFMETSVRRILTKEQLVKFRQLRENSKNRPLNPNKMMNPNKMDEPPNGPLRRRLNRQNQRPAN